MYEKTSEKYRIKSFASIIKVKQKSRLEFAILSNKKQKVDNEIVAITNDKTRDRFNSVENENYITFLYRLNPKYEISIPLLFIKKFSR